MRLFQVFVFFSLSLGPCGELMTHYCAVTLLCWWIALKNMLDLHKRSIVLFKARYSSHLVQLMPVIVLMLTTSNRQLTYSDPNHTGKAEDSSCSQRSDRSRRVGGTRRSWWPWAPTYWEVRVGETQCDLWCTALSSQSSSLSPPSCRLWAASLSPNYKFSSLKEQTKLLAHYHSSH